MTKDIDKYCPCGYNLIWSDLLNLCMVDYDIIRKLKTYVGYTHWNNVSNKQKLLCFRSFDDNFNLPDRDAEQEKYWAQILVTVHTECWSYRGQRIIERDIQKWKITLYIGKIGITIVMEVIIEILHGWRTSHTKCWTYQGLFFVQSFDICFIMIDMHGGWSTCEIYLDLLIRGWILLGWKIT